MNIICKNQIILNAGQLFAAIDEQLVKLIPTSVNWRDQELNNTNSRNAASLYKSGCLNFQTCEGQSVYINYQPNAPRA